VPPNLRQLVFVVSVNYSSTFSLPEIMGLWTLRHHAGTGKWDACSTDLFYH